MIVQLPPYSLSIPAFRFKALASHAGQASLGGDRELVLACYVVARLAAGMLPPFDISPQDTAARAANTRQWLASLNLSAPARSAASAAVDAVESGDSPLTVAALSTLLEVAVAQLDQSSVAELHELMGELSARQ